MAEAEERLREKINYVQRSVADAAAKTRSKAEAGRGNIDRAEVEARAKDEAEIKEKA